MTDRHLERDLRILSAIEEGAPLTQRVLAERVGVALGLANLCLKRLARKGYIKVVHFNDKPAARKRLRYLLTAKGLAEKSRLSYEHLVYSLNLYRRTRQTLRESLGSLRERGMKRLALYGTGDAAELAYLTLKECGLEPVGVYAAAPGGEFLGFPVRPVAGLNAEEIDGLVVATFERPEPVVLELERGGVPRAKCVTLRRMIVGRSA
ncbi:MAG TPA: winged helix-turn-helix transcriptional regulator [Methylomirabilota bacterium]|nr:winged helix-turn-helix transcriptional regulator [Methylomirabilota bacterium]